RRHAGRRSRPELPGRPRQPDRGGCRRSGHPVDLRACQAKRSELRNMVTVLDRITDAPRARHPEKAHRPDQEVLRKPDWIRVKAPTSKGYADTRAIVKANKLVT